MTIDPPARLRAQAEALLSSDTFTRSPALESLFRFLLACSLDDRAPKAAEIADEVFGQARATADDDVAVRTHIHRLRRKLDEFYGGPGAAEAVRIIVPKGEYRLITADLAPPASAAPAASPSPAAAMMPGARRASGRGRVVIPVGAGLALLLAAGWAGWLIGRDGGRSDPAIEQTRASALWAPIIANGRRTAIVVGDYYLFGERDANGDTARLVRRFDINSPRDLAQAIEHRPDLTGTAVNLGLTYLPVGVADALRAVVPVLVGNARERADTLAWPASALSLHMMKSANLVYLGYLSGLGALRDPMFSGSRFAIGASYDAIVDRRTGRVYLAGTYLDQTDEGPRQDYAIIAAFRNIAGNRVVIIAGTRDAALTQAAEFATRADTVAKMTRGLPAGGAFEALLVVEGAGSVGLSGQVVVSASRPDVSDWSAKPPQVFPDHDAAGGRPAGR